MGGIGCGALLMALLLLRRLRQGSFEPIDNDGDSEDNDAMVSDGTGEEVWHS